MRTQRTAIAILVLLAALCGCMDRRPAPVCPVPTELKTDEVRANNFDGVDMLVVVDDSGSMFEEQTILATSFYPLVNALANPLPTWQYEAVDSLRLAVVTSNMGISSDGQSNDAYWPGGDAPDGCHDLGDNGGFREIEVATVDVQNDVIACAADAAQCPSGWTCENIDAATGVGRCHTDGSTEVDCPALDSAWAESTADAPNPSFNTQAACLAVQGTSGCGFEQQLQSAATALGRSDQDSFMVDSHLLAVLVVSDEEDCSMEDGKSLFGTDEVAISTPNKVNVACGEHPELLFDPQHFYDTFVEAKGGPNAVIFAAIVGVPYGDQPGADECQGLGDELGACLEQDAMQLDQVQHDDSAWYYGYACERGTVTKAYPGRRYVELANEHFGNMSYVYSICNDDWSPAMEEVAGLIGAKIQATCYKKPLDWDSVEKVAKCNVVVEYDNPEKEECPPEFDGAEPVIEHETSSDGEEITLMYCAIPKLPSERECTAQTEDQAAAIDSGFGWYYCENVVTESTETACGDGVDNDGDGLTDCADVGDGDHVGCDTCAATCGGDGSACGNACKYTVQLTGAAKKAVAGRQVAVQCLQQFSFEDRNCQENTRSSCTDSEDNDGNGIWDCTGEEDHMADPNCCPMVGEPGAACDLAPDGIGETWDEICPSGEVTYTNGYPDACREAASRLGCTLP